MGDEAELLFEAVIVPHRSLSPRGMRILILALCLLCSASGTVFFLLGAWPVMGFCGAEIGLAVYLLRLNARARREREIVSLSEGAVRIVRVNARGESSSLVLSAMWLSLRLRESPGRVPRLLLVNRGRETEIGRCLGEEEKRDLARCLEAALFAWRNPVFANPQLGVCGGRSPR